MGIVSETFGVTESNVHINFTQIWKLWHFRISGEYVKVKYAFTYNIDVILQISKFQFGSYPYLELVNCGCKKTCNTNRCQCLREGNEVYRLVLRRRRLLSTHVIHVFLYVCLNLKWAANWQQSYDSKPALFSPTIFIYTPPPKRYMASPSPAHMLQSPSESLSPNPLLNATVCKLGANFYRKWVQRTSKSPKRYPCCISWKVWALALF